MKRKVRRHKLDAEVKVIPTNQLLNGKRKRGRPPTRWIKNPVLDLVEDDEDETEENIDNRGGYRPGAGRPKGIPTPKKVTLFDYMNVVFQNVFKDRTKDNPPTALEIFQAIYRDDKIPANIRKDAADKCLPYESGKITSKDFPLPPGVKSGGGDDGSGNSARETLRQKLLGKDAEELGEEVSSKSDRQRGG